MNSDRVGAGLLIVFGLIVGAVIVFIGNGLSCLPNNCGTFFFGGKGYLEVLVSMGTFVAAIVAASLAFQSYRMNREIGLVGRFQKGLELLNSGSTASQIGGILLIRDVVSIEPELLQWPALGVLSQVVREKHLETIDKVYALTNKDVAPTQWDRTHPTAVNALRAIARTPLELRWKLDDGTRAEFEVFAFYLHEYRISRRDFTKIGFRRSLVIGTNRVSDTGFADCTFAANGMVFRVSGKLLFERCTFDDTVKVSLFDLFGKVAPDFRTMVLFRDCTFKGVLEVNGTRVNDNSEGLAKLDDHDVVASSRMVDAGSDRIAVFAARPG